jgi:hypothetical protein
VNVEELYNCRADLFESSRDEFGFIQPELILSEVLPFMLDAKLIDSEDYNNSYYKSSDGKIKVNAYMVNESGERLQLFIVDEKSSDESFNSEELNVSRRADYEKQFKRVDRFVNNSLKGILSDQLQDSDPVKALISKISSASGIKQFDVIEVFLVTLNATVSFKGSNVEPRNIYFKEEHISCKYKEKNKILSKDFLVLNRVIDLNFIANIIESRGNREVLTINFKKDFSQKIELIQAANENNFESYLCVLNANILSDLYKKHSSRLLEKNVRSFLQFKGVNRGIRETIRIEPEKFIAFNNGITITSTSAKVYCHKKSLILESLSDFQIVNGGQTTASIYFSQKDGFDISQVKVMAKINIVKESNDSELDTLISKISKYSNSQSKVSSVDLRSRSPQLVKLKKLSESIVTPNNTKWFFERAKGEFNTKVRIAGSKNKRIKDEFPPSRRFSKEQLAKYYSAWGEKPYLVKKGGEKIFRNFIEEISVNETSSEPIEIDREFYEALISKIIMFRDLEKLYGQGKNSMGQLRSAVIPYSISIVYYYTDGTNNTLKFNLSSIWKKGNLEQDLSDFFETLMLLINELIKKYSLSDDYGEFSKNPELWESIKSCDEVIDFMSSTSSVKLIEKYANKVTSPILKLV